MTSSSAASDATRTIQRQWLRYRHQQCGVETLDIFYDFEQKLARRGLRGWDPLPLFDGEVVSLDHDGQRLLATLFACRKWSSAGTAHFFQWAEHRAVAFCTQRTLEYMRSVARLPGWPISGGVLDPLTARLVEELSALLPWLRDVTLVRRVQDLALRAATAVLARRSDRSRTASQQAVLNGIHSAVLTHFMELASDTMHTLARDFRAPEIARRIAEMPFFEEIKGAATTLEPGAPHRLMLLQLEGNEEERLVLSCPEEENLGFLFQAAYLYFELGAAQLMYVSRWSSEVQTLLPETSTLDLGTPQEVLLRILVRPCAPFSEISDLVLHETLKVAGSSFFFDRDDGVIRYQVSSEKTGKRDFLTVVLPMWNVGELAGSRKFFHIFDATQHRFISVRCSVGCFLRWMREIVGRMHCEPNLQWVRDVPLGVPSSWQSGATIAQEMFLSMQETFNGYMLPAKSMFSSLLPENCVSRRSCRRACGSRCLLLETWRHHTERLSSSQVESATESELQREAARDFDEPDSRRFSNKSSESPRPESLPQLVAATVATSLPDVSFWRSHHKLVQVWSLAPHQAVLPSSCPEVYMPICAVIPGAVGGLAFGCGRGPLGAGVGAAVGAALSELGRQLLSRLPETVYLRDHSWIWSDYKGEYLMRHIEAKPWFPQYELGIAFCALVGATLQGSVCLHAYLLGEISARDLLRRLLVAFRTGAISWSLTALIMYILHCGQFCTTGGLHRALTIVMAHRSSAVFGIHNCVFGAVQWLQEQGKQVTELAALTGASVTALLISFALGCDMCPLQLRIPLVGMAAQCGGSIAYANLLKARKLVLQARLCELAREVLGLPSGHTEAELHQRLSILVRLAHPTSNCSVGAAASVRLFVRCRDVLLVDADVGKDRQFVRLIKVWARRNVSITDQLPSVGLAADEISL